MDDMASGLMGHFIVVRDPRVQKRKKHKLVDILVIAVCAVICGAEGWEEMERYGLSKLEWLKTFLELPHGIPSDDTFARVFSIIDPLEFQRCFAAWVAAIRESLKGLTVAIDGKTLRHSFDRATGKNAIHMVSAWVVENQVILGQLKVDEKSNEITAVPKLLDMLDIRGATVTTDAMGCQTEIAAKIVDKGAHYVFCLKGNQGTAHSEVRDFFSFCQKEKFKDVPHGYFETNDKGHGRVETRKYWQTSEIGWFEDKDRWKGLTTIGMVTAERLIGDKTTSETRFFLSSMPVDAEKFSQPVRGHWGIENGLHWCLDVGMGEDACRIRKKNADENFAVLRRIALNLLKQEKTEKCGVKSKGKLCCWNNNYLLKVLWG
jgi:predicted transposase YbfD/YdcC